MAKWKRINQIQIRIETSILDTISKNALEAILDPKSGPGPAPRYYPRGLLS